MDLGYKLEDAIQNFAQAVDRKTAAQIDAACCRTAIDKQNAEEAEIKAEKAEEELKKAIAEEIQFVKKAYSRCTCKKKSCA